MRRLALALLVAACGPGVSGSDHADGGVVTFDAAPRPIDAAPIIDVIPIPTNCQFVDVLFVIDNSLSMGPYQEKLAQAFPTFVDAMYERLPPNVSLHVGITTTSFYTGSCSEFISNCRTTASQSEINSHYVRPQDGNTGTNGEQGRLFQWAGKSYFEANSSDANRSPLKTWFSGAAVAAGETGCSFEMSSAGAGYAFHAANSATNGGFLRDDDAVLLIVVLSDEPDKSPEGTAAYHDMVTSAKSVCGGDSCVVTAGILNPCVEDVNNSIWGFLHSFGRDPVTADIDGPITAYQAVVGDALAEVVEQTCVEIVQ